MPTEVVSVGVVMVCVMIVAITAQWRRARQSTLDLQLLRAGTLTTGKVVAINRPFGLPHEAHVYFSYSTPRGTLMQCSCVDLRALRDHSAVEIPSVGTQISIRYLSDAPEHAVIPQLLPCLAGFHPTPAAQPAAPHS